MLVKKMKTDFEFSNENGSLVQLVHDGWKQVNVLISKKGSKRGGHFHKENQEAFYIVEGKLILILDENEEHEETEFSTGEMFMISPYQMHNFIFWKIQLWYLCIAMVWNIWMERKIFM